MANKKYFIEGISTMEDMAQITDAIIDWNGTTHNPSTKTIILQVDYFSDIAQVSPTMSRNYTYVYTGVLDSFNTTDGWNFLLSLPQHIGGTLIV